jgi:zinc/manganese transport system substrate-binding protein
MLLLAGCADSGGGSAADTSGAGGDAVSVVATTTFWGDITSQVLRCAGAGTVDTLTPVGADPHDYSPSSQDIGAMVSADLVITNGLGLEEGLTQSLASAAQDGARILELGPQLDPQPLSPSPGEDADAADTHSGDDPHVWLDVARAARAATIIGAELTQVTGSPTFTDCGASVGDELTQLDQDVAATLARVEPEKRILVTDHDALEYFAAAYGYEVAGTVVPGGSTLAEPSSAELAALAATVQAAGVPAIFANVANPQALVDALAAEAGDVEVVELYIGSLGPAGSGADTYQTMMTTNAQRISDALAG